MLRTLRRPFHGRTIVLTAALLLGCGNEPTDPGGPVVADVDEFVGSLGTWETFAPPAVDGDAATGPETTIEEVVGSTTYQCTVTPRSLTSTPNELVMYEPNASIMWVGNLLQGDSYKGGTGSFEELSIRQRAPLKVSIDLLTGDNFAIVENPSLTSVQAAIGQLIQRASDAGHLSGSSINYSHRRMYTTLEAIRKSGLSANFLYQGVPVELTAEVGWELDASLRGVFAHFTQKMFTISIELPQSPGAMFSDELTPELLQAQVDAGNIGPNNLPVYIASITYGRTLTYTLVSADVEAKLRAAVEASIKGFQGIDGSAFTETELRTTLGSESLRATAIGGTGVNVINLIREGQLSAYFTEDAPLTSARPISYQLNYLGNNSIAKVSETTDYDLRECNEKPVSPGRFDFTALQSVTAGINTPYNVLQGDVNGDGHGDIVLSNLTGGPNQTRIGLGQANGTFTFGATIAHPVTPTETWADNYTANVGDFDGDGDDDLVWTRPKSGEPMKVFVALSDGVGGLSFLPVETSGASWANSWRTLVGNVDGDADDDLYFNYLATGANYSILATSDGDGTFTFGARQDHSVAGSWAPYTPYIADVNGGTGRDDIIWNHVPSGGSNSAYVALSNGDRTLSFRSLQTFLTTWTGYASHLGDVNGDQRADMIWAQTHTGTFYVHRALGQSSGSLSIQAGAASMSRDTGQFGNSGQVPTHVGDFNGDGRTDILFNRRAASNNLAVGLGNSTGGFDFSEAPQAHPATGEDWTQYIVRTMDVTGEGVGDVVWLQATPTLKIYVATGR